MWTLAVFALCLTSAVLCLDSNEIRSSREIITDSEPTVMPSENSRANLSVLNNVRPRQKSPECTNQQVGTEARRNQCVRSFDCGEGWCCVQYAGGRRCQRVLQEGEMCRLVQPKSKSQRRLSRCSCMAGLSCLPMPGGLKGQGECRVHEKETDTPH
ncbi:hypothetical protein QTP70_029342 [Hemibagrus guttatus]|uniref:Uncharacterized protein n=1 Tax=Hemibagrus guttatus TaxID=175788 RepID=A0AAE0R2X1_9TELE|nr:hypothetical protein QTP70_029342 [Hemibagrus guttatus]